VAGLDGMPHTRVPYNQRVPYIHGHIRMAGTDSLCVCLCGWGAVVPDVAGGLTEEKVGDKCFELVFAFDEVISTGGHRENINLQQIKTHMVRRDGGWHT
jgi:hypothetical protein